ncbi:TIGR03086 family metal-binding protein [Rhodococcus sp. NPDC127528]|uniref:TIGR03086 family metal-binding protein n=1 Tax=unclassified Rhodococcus (in: high G+C Gram-positive bacteria) TaxID=192944 RepID=UPI00363803C8
MAPTPEDQLARVLADTTRLVAAVRDDQWDAPTPCTEWTVRQLVAHLVSGNTMFAEVVSRRQPAGIPGPPPVESLGSDPVAAYREAADAVLAAFRQPGAHEQQITVPFGTVPGIVALHLRITEVLTHGWDLARATGQEVHFPDALAEQELEFTRSKLSAIPPDRSPFGPPQEVADDAPAIDRLAACLGRRP